MSPSFWLIAFMVVAIGFTIETVVLVGLYSAYKRLEVFYARVVALNQQAISINEKLTASINDCFSSWEKVDELLNSIETEDISDDDNVDDDADRAL